MSSAVLPSHVGCGLLVCLSLAASAAPLAAVGSGSSHQAPAIEATQDLDYSRVHAVGAIRLLVTNWGQIGSQPGSGLPWSGAPSAEWPAGSGHEHLWAGGLWIGALLPLQAELAVTTSLAPQEFLPPPGENYRVYESAEGQIGGARDPFPEADDDGDGVVDEDWLDGLDNDGDGAIDEDFAAVSDQMFFSEYSDTDPNIVLGSPNHVPLQFKVQQSSFAWEGQGLENFIGFDYKLIAQSATPLADVYVGFFADCDVGPRGQSGGGADDQAGFWEGVRSARVGGVSRNVKLSVGYMYDDDQDSGSSPGWIGIVFLGGQQSQGCVLNPVQLANVRISEGQVSYEQGGDPITEDQRYEVLNGRAPRSLPPRDPLTGLRPPGSTTSPGDYRLVVSAGPLGNPSGSDRFVEQGDTLSVQFGLVFGAGFDEMIENAARAQAYYEGAWVDRDQDPTTGIGGRETPLCGPECTGLQVRLDLCDELCDVAPPSNENCYGRVPADGCVWVNGDCELERYGHVTGRDGREHRVRWFDDLTAPELDPDLVLLPPVEAGVVLSIPPDLVMRWTYATPGGGFFVEPDSTRWVVIPSEVAPGGQFTSFPDSLVTLPDRFQWSPWAAWNAADGSGMRAEIRNLLRVGAPGAPGGYIFAVQAKDDTGALTPGFDWSTPGRNNVALMRVTGTSGPILRVTETHLGASSILGSPIPVAISAIAGEPLQFHWYADATRYGGVVTDYRYGWDLLNPDDDSSWDVDWGPDVDAAERSFQTGTHRLRVEARDDLGVVTAAVFEIQLISFTGERNLLFVDDAWESTSEDEARADVRWLTALQSIATNTNIDFDPTLDVYDVADQQNLPPPLEKIFQYKMVLWDVQRGPSGSVLGRPAWARFTNPYTERNFNSAANFNVLKTYLAAGGKLWVSGFRPAYEAWPTERAHGAETDPVNVTNWVDPILPDPNIDSVGTTSWLYEQGVEMFDLGAGLVSTRQQLAHFCQGVDVEMVGAPVLEIDPLHWPTPLSQPSGLTGRPNIEIYNMPEAMVQQTPRLVPRSDLVQVVYSYVSGEPIDPDRGFFYPLTADRQPVFLLARTAVDQPASRALSGFRPHLLEQNSHEQLARFVLRQFGLLPVPVLLQSFEAAVIGDAVQIDWQLSQASDAVDFLLRAHSGGHEWTVDHSEVDARTFTAIDEVPHPGSDGRVTYSLYFHDETEVLILLWEEEVRLSDVAVPAVTLLLAPQPNPFNPRVVIPFVLSARQHLKLEIYAADGRRVNILVDTVRSAGRGTVVWDGRDTDGRGVASGIYVVRLQSGGTTMSRKLVLVR